MVGGLVEQEQPGALEQQLGERDAHLPTAGEGFRRPAQVVLSEAETAQHSGNAQVEAVAVGGTEAILDLGVAREHGIVLDLRHRRVAEALFQGMHLGFHVEQRLKGRGRLVVKRAAGMQEAVLGQVADGQPGGLDNLPPIEVLQPRQHPHQRRLAGAVGPAQADAVAQAELPCHAVEQRSVAEDLRELEQLKHGPSAHIGRTLIVYRDWGWALGAGGWGWGLWGGCGGRWGCGGLGRGLGPGGWGGGWGLGSRDWGLGTGNWGDGQASLFCAFPNSRFPTVQSQTLTESQPAILNPPVLNPSP